MRTNSSARHLALNCLLLVCCGDEDVDAPIQRDLVALDQVSQIAVGGAAASGAHVCALRLGEVYCWGSNLVGQTGQWPASDSYMKDARKVEGLTDVVKLSAGGGETCAVTRAGELWCWGNYRWLAATSVLSGKPEEEPFRIDAGGIVTDVSVGFFHTCFLVNDGTVKCWGSSRYGEAGLLAREPCDYGGSCIASPQVVVAAGATAISAGESHTCALVSGRVQCGGPWPITLSTPIWDSREPGAREPGEVIELPSVPMASAIASSAGSACALADGATYCWGFNDQGEAGDADTQYGLNRIDIAASAVAMTANFTCALRANGKLSCWGNVGAPFGVNYISSKQPLELDGVGDLVQIDGGEQRLCGLRRNGHVTCWDPSGPPTNVPAATEALTYDPPLPAPPPAARSRT
jgi:alpha-tubulin suppressor-like RCC1 family protein